MNELQVIKRTSVLNQELNIYGTLEEPLFLAQDVSNWIEHTDLSRMMNLVDDDEKLKRTLYVSGQNREMWFLTEDGLYEVLMQSRKPIAKQFKKNVKKILKELRMNQVVAIPTNPMDAIKMMIAIHEDSQEKIDEIDTRVIDLEENVSLNPGEYNTIGRKVGERIRLVCTDRKWNLNKVQKSILYRAINTDITKVAGVRTRSQLKQKDFDVVYDLIIGWEPSRATVIEIENMEDELWLISKNSNLFMH